MHQAQVRQQSKHYLILFRSVVFTTTVQFDQPNKPDCTRRMGTAEEMVAGKELPDRTYTSQQYFLTLVQQPTHRRVAESRWVFMCNRKSPYYGVPTVLPHRGFHLGTFILEGIAEFDRFRVVHEASLFRVDLALL